jgi:hypothetical protein
MSSLKKLIGNKKVVPGKGSVFNQYTSNTPTTAVGVKAKAAAMNQKYFLNNMAEKMRSAGLAFRNNNANTAKKNANNNNAESIDMDPTSLNNNNNTLSINSADSRNNNNNTYAALNKSRKNQLKKNMKNLQNAQIVTKSKQSNTRRRSRR